MPNISAWKMPGLISKEENLQRAYDVGGVSWELEPFISQLVKFWTAHSQLRIIVWLFKIFMSFTSFNHVFLQQIVFKAQFFQVSG